MHVSNSIIIRGAREHNLKGIDLEIPRDVFVVITGLSGSGKSSLAFDTIYAEGQRRYVESLSAYARQFLGQMEKPDVDSIEGLSPAISIDQKAASHNPRSTVGTVTEIYDYLRVLYARTGHPHCPQCGSMVSQQTPQQMVDRIMGLPEGTRFMILAPIIRGRKGEHEAVLDEMAREGFTRVRVDGTIIEIGEGDRTKLARYEQHTIEAVVDRLVARDGIRHRLTESMETALRLGGGSAELLVLRNGRHGSGDGNDGDGNSSDGNDGDGNSSDGNGDSQRDSSGDNSSDRNDTGTGSTANQEEEVITFSEDLACTTCGISFSRPEPRNFSFNSPYGACSSCNGLGTRFEVDPDLVVPDGSLSLANGAIAPWARARSGYFMKLVEALSAELGFSMDTPWKKLKTAHRQAILYGTKGDRLAVSYRNRYGRRRSFTTSYEGVIPWLERRHAEADSDSFREAIEEYMREVLCHACNGARLNDESLAVTVDGLSIYELCSYQVSRLPAVIDGFHLTERELLVAERLLKEVKSRLQFLVDVGLGYLTLARSTATLSGGEAQRIRLASQIGSGLVGVLYVLDEPSIGLHQRDNIKLINALKRLRDLGNTVIVVEHDEETIRSADTVVDIGPGAGEHGGRVVYAGAVDGIEEAAESLTGAYLAGRMSIDVPARRRKGTGKKLWIRGVSEHNLKDINVSIPLGCMVAVAGVSGSGKSTLVNDVMLASLRKSLYGTKTQPGKHRKIEGVKLLDKVVAIDQSPIGRTPRSNPATYTGVFDHIRRLFSQVPEAQVRGYQPGRFSFNLRGGRCESCSGDGTIRIEMHFLPDVYVPCEVCEGTRYNRETLEITWKGKNIADVLSMSCEEAAEFFSRQPAIHRYLSTLVDVGLGYVRLGQPAPTLSGGEAQRVKLASELQRRSTGNTLYVLDEPTTGLHFDDVRKLLAVLNRLVDQGNTVVVIEHNLDVIKSADWIVELGPEGGDQGGYLVAEGTPEDLCANSSSATGEVLKPVLAH